MNRKTKLFILLLGLGILATIFIIWSISEYKISYKEPQEALLAENEDMLLIPSYVAEEDAMFFFIDEQKNLGLAKVFKSFFGWKVGFLSWSPITKIIKADKINGYQIQEDQIIYGLMKDGEDHVINVNNETATTFNLELYLPSELDNITLKGLYLWYYETENFTTVTSLSLVNQSTNKVIDKYEFP